MTTPLETPRTDAIDRMPCGDDPGYVLGRALDLARQLERELTALKDGYVLVPKSALDWLHGLGDDFQCPDNMVMSFGEPRYWWRKVFREKSGYDPFAASDKEPL